MKEEKHESILQNNIFLPFKFGTVKLAGTLVQPLRSVYTERERDRGLAALV